jgi:uncharacterized membrane protein YidH (DUF202 family)
LRHTGPGRILHAFQSNNVVKWSREGRRGERRGPQTQVVVAMVVTIVFVVVCALVYMSVGV